MRIANPVLHPPPQTLKKLFTDCSTAGPSLTALQCATALGRCTSRTTNTFSASSHLRSVLETEFIQASATQFDASCFSHASFCKVSCLRPEDPSYPCQSNQGLGVWLLVASTSFAVARSAPGALLEGTCSKNLLQIPAIAWCAEYIMRQECLLRMSPLSTAVSRRQVVVRVCLETRLFFLVFFQSDFLPLSLPLPLTPQDGTPAPLKART